MYCCTYCKKECGEAKKITITELHEFTPEGPYNQHSISAVFYACDSCLQSKKILPADIDRQKVHEMDLQETDIYFGSQEEMNQIKPFVQRVLEAIAALGYSVEGYFSDETLIEEFFETTEPEESMTKLAKILKVSFKETDYLVEVARKLAAKENKLN